MNKKLIVFILFLLLISVTYSFAQVGVGITSYRIILQGKVGQTYIQTVGIMNPSPQPTKVRVSFECQNCVEEVSLFGFKLFEKIEKPTEYFSLDKDLVDIPANTIENNAVPITITFTPKILIIKEAKFYTPDWLNFFIQSINPSYEGSFSIPYLSLLIGERYLTGKLAADVIEYEGRPLGVMPSVAATLEMRAYGMPLGSFIFLVLIILVIFSFIVYKNRKKLVDFGKKLVRKH